MRTQCARKSCTTDTSHVSGYCSDVCLLLDQDFDAPPVTVLASGKAGGVGRGLQWQIPQLVNVPPAA